MFSVIIPLYNKAQYILRSINSVLTQSFVNFELIIINDGSTDDSVMVIENNVSDSRVRIVNKVNGGVSSARNRGIQEAAYNYICFLDADDVWHTAFLSYAHSSILKKPNLKVLGFKFTLFTKEEQLINNIPYSDYDLIEVKDYFKRALDTPLFNSSAIIIDKSVFQMAGKFDETLTHGEDLDMWFRLMMKVDHVYYIPYVLSFYFVGDDNQATKNLPTLRKHLVGNLLAKHKEEYLLAKIPYFTVFINEYLLRNLRPFYMRDAESREVDMILKELVALGGRLNWFYRLPRGLVKRIYLLKKQWA